MEETDVPVAQEEPVVAEEAQVEQEEAVAEEIPTLTDEFLENMAVESEEESGEESEKNLVKKKKVNLQLKNTKKHFNIWKMN